jgi:hypothetical protein
MGKVIKTKSKRTMTTNHRVARNSDSSQKGDHLAKTALEALDLIVTAAGTIATTIEANGESTRHPQERRTTTVLCTMIHTSQIHHQINI